MKKSIYLSLIMLLLASCMSSAKPSLSVSTDISSLTSTIVPVPTTQSLTSIPAIPTSTITPMAVDPVSADPSALSEFNAGTEMKRLRIIGTGTPHNIKFSPNGKLLAVATGRGIFIYDGTTFEQNSFIDVNDSVSAISFSPDGNILALAVEGKASLWNVISGQNILELEGGMISISSLTYGRGGYVAALGGECRGCGTPVVGMILWNAKTGRQIYAEHNIPYSTSALSFTRDGKQLVFGGNRGLTIIEADTGKLISVYNGSEDSHFPYNLVLTNDESRFIISTYFFNELTMIADKDTQEELRLSHCGIYMTQA